MFHVAILSEMRGCGIVEVMLDQPVNRPALIEFGIKARTEYTVLTHAGFTFLWSAMQKIHWGAPRL